jgi:hypothetical protein
LRVDNKRKAHAMYWSFEEFGERLTSEHAWMIGGIMRSPICSDVEGGLSTAFKKSMQDFFGPVHNFLRSGVTVQTCTGSTFLLFAELGATLTDESADKDMYNVKGASGMKPCRLCKNVLLTRLGIMQNNDPYFVDLQCIDPTRFDEHDNDSVWESVDLLRNFRGPPKLLKVEEQKLGINRNLDTVLFDAGLREYVLPVDHAFLFFLMLH